MRNDREEWFDEHEPLWFGESQHINKSAVDLLEIDPLYVARLIQRSDNLIIKPRFGREFLVKLFTKLSPPVYVSGPRILPGFEDVHYKLED